MTDRLNIGRCRSAHGQHLMTAPRRAWKRKLARASVRPHASQQAPRGGVGLTDRFYGRHAFAGVGAKRGIPESAGGVRVTDLRFGQEAPGFSLPSSAGGQTALSDFKGKSDVVLVFYCYDWGSI